MVRCYETPGLIRWGICHTHIIRAVRVSLTMPVPSLVQQAGLLRAVRTYIAVAPQARTLHVLREPPIIALPACPALRAGHARGPPTRQS